MVGVEDERDIERLGGFLRLWFAADQVKEMFRFGQIVTDRRE